MSAVGGLEDYLMRLRSSWRMMGSMLKISSWEKSGGTPRSK